MRIARLCVLLLWVALAASADAARPLRLATLNWAPYVAPGLDQQGLSAYIIGSAARQFGRALEIDYFPWNRALQLGLHGPGYAGYYPAYYTEQRARECYFSSPIGTSTLGLAYLKSAPVHWRRLEDLAPFTIGVVAGYSSGAEFDRLVAQHKLTIDPSPNDTLNLRKLLAGRVQAVVIDRLVMRFLLLAEPDLRKQRRRLALSSRPVAELPLYVFFRRTPEGRQLQRKFDAALQTLPLHAIENRYFGKLEGNANAPQADH